MSGSRRERLEGPIQAEIEAELGAEPDLLLLRNTVGHVKYYDEKTGEPRHITYGLGKGSPDLVGILRIGHKQAVMGAGGKLRGYTTDERPDIGIWFCLEVKAIGGDFEPGQEKAHEIWRSFGALVFVVHSAAEARQALIVARGMVAS